MNERKHGKQSSDCPSWSVVAFLLVTAVGLTISGAWAFIARYDGYGSRLAELQTQITQLKADEATKFDELSRDIELAEEATGRRIAITEQHQAEDETELQRLHNWAKAYEAWHKHVYGQ